MWYWCDGYPLPGTTTTTTTTTMAAEFDTGTTNSWLSGGLGRWLGAGSSPVDWCEDNYTVSPHIAEFVNTLSNALFVLVPAAAMRLWSSYAKQVSRGVHAVWLLFTVVGLSSAYFHATLSLLGQLLDELSILWVLMLSYTLFTPAQYWSRYTRNRFSVYAFGMAFLACLITVSAFFRPAVNAYALFLVGVPAVRMLVSEIRATRDPKVVKLGVRTLLALILAALAWTSDRFMCWVWKAVHLPVLHALWHVLIFITAYGMQVLFCYFHAAQDVPESRPVLRFWPRRAFSWGLPYVYCLSAGLDKTP